MSPDECLAEGGLRRVETCDGKPALRHRGHLVCSFFRPSKFEGQDDRYIRELAEMEEWVNLMQDAPRLRARLEIAERALADLQAPADPGYTPHWSEADLSAIYHNGTATHIELTLAMEDLLHQRKELRAEAQRLRDELARYQGHYPADAKDAPVLDLLKRILPMVHGPLEKDALAHSFIMDGIRVGVEWERERVAANAPELARCDGAAQAAGGAG